MTPDRWTRVRQAIAGPVAAVAILATYLLLRALVEPGTSTVLRAARGLLPATAVAAFALVQLKQAHRLDEMQRQIQFEALAFGYSFAFVILLGIRFLQAEGLLLGWTLAEVWPLVPFPYFVGLFVAWLRYR